MLYNEASLTCPSHAWGEPKKKKTKAAPESHVQPSHIQYTVHDHDATASKPLTFRSLGLRKLPSTTSLRDASDLCQIVCFLFFSFPSFPTFVFYFYSIFMSTCAAADDESFRAKGQMTNTSRVLCNHAEAQRRSREHSAPPRRDARAAIFIT